MASAVFIVAGLIVYVVVRDAAQWLKHFTLHKIPLLW